MSKDNVIQRSLPDLQSFQGFQKTNITFSLHPEDQIADIVRQRGSIMLAELPRNLRRTSRWTLNLERQGLLKRVQLKGKDGIKRLQLVYREAGE